MIGQQRAGGGYRDRGDDGSDIALEDVGPHPGHVTHIVADVVGDGGRIARVVLRDTGFHLANQIGAYVGGLGVDPTTHTCEEGDR